ncbi:glycerate kinase [Staphylococcus arlettae]|uniref:glycerate kinase n=1 Tax=Staphylococcus arlettae TaxID=29378 RepID=UPI00186B9879|nr:glycerate kinase [Staphylococcus arlettae]QZZ04031.1 glycerate kinase [Staphylococcus arlettae]
MTISKVIIAPDSFKESMSAMQAAQAVQQGMSKIFPHDTHYELIPMADGGEGTTDTLMHALNASYVSTTVLDPLQRPIQAQYGFSATTNTAVIEMAAASGLDLVSTTERNPLITTTYGTGQLIKSALDQGAERIILGIGGSATNDGGTGMLSALGVQFLDAQQQPLQAGGADLLRLATIDLSKLDSRLAHVSFEVACDVTNPLLGSQGASVIYGRQKGANVQMVQQLDKALAHYHNQIEVQLNISVKDIAGAGAAGGLGTGLLAFCHTTLKKGIDVVLTETKFDTHLQGADLVITGEGKIDHQTIYGKTPIGVAQLAKKYNIPVIALSGSLGEGYEAVYQHGIDAVFNILQQPHDLLTALKNGVLNIEKTAENIARVITLTEKF